MERKINEVFPDGNTIVTVVPGEDCSGCIYKGTSPSMCKKIGSVAGFCYNDLRDDHTSVIFIEKK